MSFRRNVQAQRSLEVGTQLCAERHFDAAIEVLRAANELEPQWTEPLMKLGFAYQYLGDFQSAIAFYEKVIHLQSDHARARLQRAMILLRSEQFDEGWREYEWRLRVLEITRGWIEHAPLWNGKPILGDGKLAEDCSLLIHCEQGLGDTLHFVRFLPSLRRMFRKTILLCQPAMGPLLRLKQPADSIVDSSDNQIVADAYIPLGSLPSRFGFTTDKIGPQPPYLSTDPELVGRWGERLSAISGVRIGIAWEGSELHALNDLRSVPLKCFRTLAEIEEVHLINLQKSAAAEQIAECSPAFEVIDFGDELDRERGPFMDTAAIMQHLDLVISIDSAVAHLAGALARPTWLVIPEVADWRWFLDRPFSPWYPSMRLFRKSQGRGWAEVFERMAAELKDWLNNSKQLPGPARG